MSVQYGAISWNRQKKVYDVTLLSLLALYLGSFVGVGTWLHPSATAETLLIRALGTAAFLLLNVVLCIGPLSRLDRRFLPLLYNRRHLGVTTFLLGLAHGGFALFQFHALGNVNPLVSLFISNPRYRSVTDFPFQALGFLALLILFLMAATSHDFWLRNLSAPMWKRLHMLVYVAYTLLVAHVTLGALQSETSRVLASVLIVGVATVLSVHLAAAFREKRIDRARHQAVDEGFVEVCKVDRIAEKCATVVSLSGDRVAVFRYDGKVSAISNVCQHQNGPLGEGRIIDGCVTCPWHGYQYQPESGTAPPPFKEKIPTFRVKVVEGSVFVHPRPNPPGTRVEPAKIESAQVKTKGGATAMNDFYVGYLPKAPSALARFVRKVIIVLALLAVTAALVLVVGQMQFASSAFEYGKLGSFEGIIVTRPFPTLLVTRPGQVGQQDKYSRYLLVAPGKHGADDLVAGFDGKQVHLQGQLIYRKGGTMVEITPGSISVVDNSPAVQAAARDLGTVAVTGEIVDSKCYLGVMNPGQGKVHRDCAARCLSGGIPPIFITTDGHEQFLLVGLDGRALGRDVLREFIAEPIQIQGELLETGSTQLLRVDPNALRHMPDGLRALSKGSAFVQ